MIPVSMSPLLLPPVNTVSPLRPLFSRFGRHIPGYVPLEFQIATMSFAWATSSPVSVPLDSGPRTSLVGQCQFDSREKPDCLRGLHFITHAVTQESRVVPLIPSSLLILDVNTHDPASK